MEILYENTDSSKLFSYFSKDKLELGYPFNFRMGQNMVAKGIHPDVIEAVLNEVAYILDWHCFDVDSSDYSKANPVKIEPIERLGNIFFGEGGSFRPSLLIDTIDSVGILLFDRQKTKISPRLASILLESQMLFREYLDFMQSHPRHFLAEKARNLRELVS